MRTHSKTICKIALDGAQGLNEMGVIPKTKNKSINQFVPSQGTCLGCGPGPQLGAFRKQPIDVSLLLSPSLSPSLKINK